jgi:hypothetical protein
MALSDTQIKIETVCEQLRRLLFEKNRKYGDSALNPVNIFSRKGDSLDKLLVRIDDKITRIKNSDELRPNDCIDLTGYLILVMIAKGWVNFEEFYE